jgi:hypothetical protein
MPDLLEAKILSQLWRGLLEKQGKTYYGQRAPSREELLRLAATETDREILRMENIGPKSLAWIRANQPPTVDAIRADEV